VRQPINQKCPKCSHTFKTKWGLTSGDIDQMRQDAFDRKEKVLSYNFLDEKDLSIQSELKRQEEKGETFLKDLIGERKENLPKRNVFSFFKFWK
jgi:hypothetical protein